MKSLESRFSSLGKAIEQEYLQQNYNADVFPEIAIQALDKFEADLVFSASEVARFISTTSVPQQPKLRFSDLPITVYRAKYFYIEILVWTRASTAIHQHAFSGAFKVLQGASLHSSYLWENEQTISPDLLVGEISRQSIEYLRQGDTRGIYPGNNGLIHSLFHLENPSLTLVVRTHGHPRYQPQYTLYPRSFAINELTFANDPELMMYSRLLRMSQSLPNNEFEKVWLDYICALDFPSFFYFYLKNFSDVQVASVRQNIIEKGMHAHGNLMELAIDAQELQSVRQGLVSARENITDSDQRYFLALLLFCRNRKEMRDLIEAKNQELRWDAYIANSIQALMTSDDQRVARLNNALQQSGLGGLDLGRKISGILPKLDEPVAMSQLLSLLIRGDGKGHASHALGVDIGDLEMQKLRARLQSIDALKALFES